MKKITLEKVRERIKNGDLLYCEYGDGFGHSGWSIYCNGGDAGINTEINGSHSDDAFASEYLRNAIKKYIPLSEVYSPMVLGEFLHDFRESRIDSCIYEVQPSKSEEERALEQQIETLSAQLEEAKTKLDTTRFLRWE